MIQTHPHGDGFIDTATGRRFVPVGTNYCAMLAGADMGQRTADQLRYCIQEDAIPNSRCILLYAGLLTALRAAQNVTIWSTAC